MGFDLSAKHPKRDVEGYYRSGIEGMILLRCAMVAAGVPEALVYKKFTSNDNLLVTPLQSQMIAQKLMTWLRRRNLKLDLVEADPRAHSSIDALFFVVKTVGKRKEQARLARRRQAQTMHFRIDRAARETLREFAAFCATSGGFYVS